MTNNRASKLVTPYTPLGGKDSSIKDFRPLADVEVEVEEDIPVVPKDESAPEPADSSMLTPSDEPPASETPAQTPASKESGKVNEQNETATTESSSPSSSSATSPGWVEPPAPVAPPTSGQTPTP